MSYKRFKTFIREQQEDQEDIPDFSYNDIFLKTKKNAPRIHYEKILDHLAAHAGKAEALYRNAAQHGKIPGENTLNFENKPEESKDYKSAVQYKDDVHDAWDRVVTLATNAGHDFSHLGLPSGEEIISRPVESLVADVAHPSNWRNVKGEGAGPFARQFTIHRYNIDDEDRSARMESIMYRLMGSQSPIRSYKTFLC